MRWGIQNNESVFLAPSAFSKQAEIVERHVKKKKRRMDQTD